MKDEYIEFEWKEEHKFKDMKNVYELISLSKNTGQPKSEHYWLEKFPDYAIKHYYFLDRDEKPEFLTARREKNVWRFSAMINLLQTDLDVELKECKRMGTKGRIEYSACGYPYGGITGLVMFLNSFDCKSTEIDEGGGIYKVKWISENDFELIEQSIPKPKEGKSNLWDKIKEWILK